MDLANGWEETKAENAPALTETSELSWERVKALLHPTVSPQHGVYVVLLIAFLIGVVAAEYWNWETTLALVCTAAAMQAEHAFSLQIKQRSRWQPRFLLWGGFYTVLAAGLGIYLYLRRPFLLSIYWGAIAVWLVDSLAVFHRQQRATWNECLTFAAVCLAAPLAAIVSSPDQPVTFAATRSLFSLWLLNVLFFCSSIFTVKLRKTQSVTPSVVYHTIASVIVLSLWLMGGLSGGAALAFTVVLLKFGWILWHLPWYKTTAIKNAALLETSSAVAFLALFAVLS